MENSLGVRRSDCFAACDPPIWLAVKTTSLDDAMRARTRFSQQLNLRVFQHRVMGGSSSAKADTIGQDVEEETVQWTIFAGLDISMDETHACVLDREGVVVRESKTESTAQAIAGELAKAPSCRRIVFETGRMAPILFHGLSQLGLPAVCVESRQAYQALNSLATHKTDRNDARGLAHLARTGFFKPVHVKSLPAHAVRSLISARKKLVASG